MKLTSQAEGADPVLTRAIAEDKTRWWKKPNLRYLYLFLFPTCMGIEITSGFDSQIINAVQIVDPWQEYFGHPEGALLGIIGAMYSLGAICSLPFVPFLTQRFGRRWSIFIGSWIMVLGAIIQCTAQHVGMYLAARWLLGFGIPTCIISGAAMLGELSYPKERPILTSLFNASYFIGAITAAGITFGTQSLAPSDWSWRVPSLLQAVPSLIQIALIFCVPESPRWLISKDRRDEAFEILVKYHTEGDRSSALVHAEMAQIENTIKMELQTSKQSWLDMLSSSGMRKRVMIGSLLGLFTQWSGNTLISYYLNSILESIGYTDPDFKAKLNIGLNCWALVNATSASLLVRRFPRRKMYLLCASSLLTCYCGWTIAQERFLTTGAIAAGHAVIFFMFLYSPCYNIGYNALTYTFLVELFPFAVRTRGMAIFQFFGRGAGFFSTFVNPIGLKNATWKYLIMYCVWLAFEIVCIYFLWPETYGRTLEELTFLFEDQSLQEQQEKITMQELQKDVPDERIEVVETKA
ncbi:Putative major facilitator, sugar transporter, major facilitator superfamily [Septoria linicola]|uniref:Major facilitator, sugar transporter, major facilitator superfamily n=1 Tax=Septoria linicola TaxID=215465 RepID=A0A9Q9AS12_9PEZI|nr:putative major facilitator, sugar transporter, major facilitator superfamily [Septoria linicola]USW50997.1 Putative major facilitator, sugar transporter, major facilitator superfamily [Septoria linicola]